VPEGEVVAPDELDGVTDAVPVGGYEGAIVKDCVTPAVTEAVTGGDAPADCVDVPVPVPVGVLVAVPVAIWELDGLPGACGEVVEVTLAGGVPVDVAVWLPVPVPVPVAGGEEDGVVAGTVLASQSARRQFWEVNEHR
jgi:hypothetical protein